MILTTLVTFRHFYDSLNNLGLMAESSHENQMNTDLSLYVYK